VVETRGLGRSFATLELTVDPKTRKVLPQHTVIGRNVAICARVDARANTCDPRALRGSQPQWTPATFRGRRVVVDEELERLIAPALTRVAEQQRRKLGLQVPSTMRREYEGESVLGSFLADSLRHMENADVALLNSGGLRADLPAGELVYGEFHAVFPFDNTVATITVTGEELRRLLHVAYGARKGVFQVSGLRVTLSRCPGQARLRGFTLSDGKAIDPDKRYRVVLPDFLARGGALVAEARCAAGCAFARAHPVFRWRLQPRRALQPSLSAALSDPLASLVRAGAHVRGVGGGGTHAVQGHPDDAFGGAGESAGGARARAGASEAKVLGV
jgi:5'-nucleotidase